jgi:hypothetical protein
MISDFEKLIYNKHLYHFKKHQNKPFKFRKNFDDLDEGTFFYLKKLSLFFNKFKNINLDLFFLAPYSIYKDEKYFDLKYFISPKAIKTYTLYKKQLDKVDPDSSEILESTLNSIKHIKSVCSTNNISTKQYLEFIVPGDSVPLFITDLQKQNVNFYTLFGFEQFKTRLFRNYETYKYILGDVIDSYETFYNNFIKSKKLKILVREGIKKIY